MLYSLDLVASFVEFCIAPPDADRARARALSNCETETALPSKLIVAGVTAAPPPLLRFSWGERS